MSKFHRTSSGRRQPRTTAKALALGHTLAGRISRDEQRAVLMPVRLPLENREGYRKRFAPEQRLAIRAYVGGSTLAHVVVSSAERIQLGQVDFATARELGHPYLDAFTVAWVEEHDTAWCQRWTDEYGITAVTAWQDDALERFQVRHAHREVWVIRFALDRTDSGGLLAARSEEGYTDSQARAMRDEMPAVIGDAWELHVGRPSRDREAQRQKFLREDREAKSPHWRSGAARAAATMKGLDMRSEFRLLYRLQAQERHLEALRQLELIESRVFPRSQAA